MSTLFTIDIRLFHSTPVLIQLITSQPICSNSDSTPSPPDILVYTKIICSNYLNNSTPLTESTPDVISTYQLVSSSTGVKHMTTAEMTALEAKNQELTAAKYELTEAQEIANQQISELMATNPAYDLVFAGKMADINSPIAVIESRVARITREFDKLSESTRWETSKAIRQPVIDVLKTISESPISVTMTGMTGTVKIIDGEPVVVLNPTFKSPDMSELQEMVAKTIDPSAFVDSSLVNLSVSVKNIGTPDQSIYLNPMGMKSGEPKSKGSRVGITRSKPREYFAGGSWLNAKDFLKLVLDSGDTVATNRQKGFEGAINTGSGAYNLAVETAQRLNVESRERQA